MNTISKKSNKWKKSEKELQAFFALKKKPRRNTIVFASFHDKEFREIVPQVENFFKDEDFVNVLAPRQIEPKFIHSLEQLLGKRGLRYVKRSELKQIWLDVEAGNIHVEHIPSTLILDSFGELSSIYSLVDLVIMGGTFIPIGGHNFLEAIFFDKKVFVGKFIHHYEDFVDNFKDHLQFTDNDRIGKDTNNFFFFKRSQLHGGFEKIQKLSGSSTKVADLIHEKINVNFQRS